MLLSKLNTIQNQILVGFISLSLIVGGLVYFSYRNLRKLEEVGTFKESIERMNREILTLIYIDKRILTEDAIDSAFYKQRGSSLLSEHQLYHSSLTEHLASHNQSFNLVYDATIDSLITSVALQIATYDSVFGIILEKKWERGFKDYGLEGTMRTYAHELENYTKQIPLEDLLFLRRHEKDYFLRDDSTYVQKLNNRSQLILSKLDQQPVSQRRDYAKEQLLAYTKYFNEIYEIEQDIGDKYSGLMLALSVCQNDLQHTLDEIRFNTRQKTEELANTIYFNFGFSVFICVLLGILMSYIIARLLARPVKHLQVQMQKPLEEQFAAAGVLSSYSSSEIHELQKAFRRLIATIEDQIGQISTNNELLSTQNEELVRMNEMLSESESQLQAALSVKNKFFSIIAHDLKGPIASLTAFLRMFIQYNESFSKEETIAFAQKMQTTTDSLSTLLENLLAWSRSQTGHIQIKPAQLQVYPVLQQNIELLLPKAEKKQISFVVEMPETLTLWADADVLDFVLRNLLSNALKFSYEKSEITITAKEHKGKVSISVRDQGMGIPEEVLPHLFDAQAHITTRGTANEKGTGLGLLLCKEFIEQNKGTITVESKRREGSVFTITLPKRNPSSVAAPEKVKAY